MHLRKPIVLSLSLLGIFLLTFIVQTGCSSKGKGSPAQKIRENILQEQKQKAEHITESSKTDNTIKDGLVKDSISEACNEKYTACIEKCEKSACEKRCMKNLEMCEKDLPEELKTLK